MHMALEAVTSITNRLGIAFSMMKNVVEGILTTWVTMDTKRSCAEMTIETAHFMQHILIAMRLGCAIRMSKFKNCISEQKAKMSTHKFLRSYQTSDPMGDNPMGDPLQQSYYHQNINHLPEDPFQRSNEAGAGETKLWYGMSAATWGKMHLSMATAFLKAYEIYTNFIDILFGTKR
jgi:hypothetical protein